MIELKNISKKYKLPVGEIIALDNVNLIIHENDYIGIIGHSGSGKSTLLNIIAGYEISDTGLYYYYDKDISRYNYQQRINFNKKFGFIFQEYQLLNYLPVIDNIMIGNYYLSEKISNRKLNNITDRLKINNLLQKYPDQLSGGEKQRVAIARILVGNRKIILADEPTGALDKENRRMIMDIFDDLYDSGLTIIIVTHDDNVAKHCRRIIRMDSGHVLD